MFKILVPRNTSSASDYNSCHDLPITTEDISNMLHDKCSGLYQEITDPALLFEHIADRGIQFYKSDYFHLWLETERIKNLSKNSFMYRFVDQIKYTGAAINVLPTSDVMRIFLQVRRFK